MLLQWTSTDKQGHLWRLDDLILSTVNINGVYVIYVPGTPPTTIYVGKGNVSDRLASHKQDARIITARAIVGGVACVTMASVGSLSQGGVERYLARRLAPLVGERYSADPEIAVNLPY